MSISEYLTLDDTALKNLLSARQLRVMEQAELKHQSNWLFFYETAMKAVKAGDAEKACQALDALFGETGAQLLKVSDACFVDGLYTGLNIAGIVAGER